MGLESYSFDVEFSTPPTIMSAIAFIEKAGMRYLTEKSKPHTENNSGSYYFECRTDRGMTEAHMLILAGEVTIDEFSLRFSILSPRTVIDVAFQFLTRLNEIVPIEVYDAEIRNHIFRQLRRTGKVDVEFKGLNEDDDAAIDKLCYIRINADDFRRNELEIAKRKTVSENSEGEIVGGGAATFDIIRRKGVFERFLGWIKKEL
jgi:hypothetical protein